MTRFCMLTINKEVLEIANGILTKDEASAGKLLEAVDDYMKLKSRQKHPSGYFDKSGRWYQNNPCACCKNISSPKRKFPLTLNKHCRSAVHVATSHGIDKTDLTKTYNKITKHFDFKISDDIKIAVLLCKIVTEAIFANLSLEEQQALGQVDEALNVLSF